MTYRVKYSQTLFPELIGKTALAMPHPSLPGMILVQFDDLELRSPDIGENRPGFIEPGELGTGRRWGLGWHAFGEQSFERLPDNVEDERREPR